MKIVVQIKGEKNNANSNLNAILSSLLSLLEGVIILKLKNLFIYIFIL